MERMDKVYFVACCFPPIGRGNSITNSCVANYLADYFEVDVVCMEREDGGLIAYQEDRSLEDALHRELKVKRVRGANWKGLNIALYALGVLPCYYLNWAWSVWRRRKEIFAESGVIFAVYPVFSDLVVGYWASRRYGFPLLVDFRDDFSGVMAKGWRKILRPVYRFLEKQIVRQASAITVTTELLREDLLERYGLAPEQVSVVYNVVPAAEAVDSAVTETEGVSVIYAGAMSRVQQPEVVLKAHALLCIEDPNWSERLNIEFFGPESPYFSLKIRRHLGPGRHFGGFLPQVEMSRRVAAADIGFFSLGDPTYAYATPTKLFDYIEAGVPIVASLPHGAARRIVEERQIGLVADAGDVEGLAVCLRRMVEDHALRRACRERMLDIREEYRPQVQVGKWREILVGIREANAVAGVDRKSDLAGGVPV